MNKNKLKTYAPAARRDFIQAVTDRAHFFGLGEREIAPVEESGDVAIIGGRPFPRAVAAQRKKLENLVKREGFNQVMETVAYTWFNRFLALRYMELHGYLEHGFRVLSNSGSSTVPEILEHATELDLPGLNGRKVIELKLDGSKDAELYRMLLVAQCNALHVAMPFLFEKIEDETELLLPDNLLHSDSLIRKLVTEIVEEDWREVEIIGWLYQFYISEKKEQVIGKVVKSEDIPAATQLFTPNWIVQYLVQNSIGRIWLMANPTSNLKNQWSYYIEPAEQPHEVDAQLNTLIKTRQAEDGGSLNPESLAILDPACGSGHILVEAYDVLKVIYLERGYRLRDIPRLILEKNLYGLDIDDRAAQLAGFALVMKARVDDRRLLNDPPALNVLSLQESRGLECGNIMMHLEPFGVERSTVKSLIDTFGEAKTFGSLIKIPQSLNAELKLLTEVMPRVMESGDLYAQAALMNLMPLVRQARVLGMKFDVVAANPPYMGARSFNRVLKGYLQQNYNGFEKDLFSAFIANAFFLAKNTGFISIMTSFVWMFISSFEGLRRTVIGKKTLSSLIQLEYDAFEDAKAHICTFVSINSHCRPYVGSFIRLANFKGAASQGPKTLEAIKNPDCGWFYKTCVDEFSKIPGSPIAYWIKGFDLFRNNSIKDYFVSGGRNKTHDNDKYLRFWWEVSAEAGKWVTYANGGDFRKFYGNKEWVIDWSSEAKDYYASHGGLCNSVFWGKEGITWSLITSAITGFRIKKASTQYSSGSPTIFTNDSKCDYKALGFLNSKVARYFLAAINPTINTTINDVFALPYSRDLIDDVVSVNTEKCIEISEKDWNFRETSSRFSFLPLLSSAHKKLSLSESFENFEKAVSQAVKTLQFLETENNRVIIEAYALQDELTAEIPEDQITLLRADRETDMKRLVSYSIGCMMGRYSLDQAGLAYAAHGNIGFESSKYKTFMADDDGIVPIMDNSWFLDDAASRFEQFLKVAWTPAKFEENLKFVAHSLSPKNGETPRETIQRYISSQFFKDHIQTYRKRPIYWLFSSGKQKAFECLVYLHRYNESTLSRMRNEYVTPLQGKFSAQVDYLSNEVNAATSTAERTRLQKQLDTLRKKQVELVAFDDLLRHYADQRISLDLDDGVKVNYGKFGSLLAEVKAVAGATE